MKAEMIRARIDETAARLPRTYPERDREDFVYFVFEMDGWAEAGPFSLRVEHPHGVRIYSPARRYLLEVDYRYFREALDDDHIDKERLARAHIESLLALCGHPPSLWTAWAMDVIGRAVDLHDALASRGGEFLAANAIDILVARQHDLARKVKSHAEVADGVLTVRVDLGDLGPRHVGAAEVAGQGRPIDPFAGHPLRPCQADILSILAAANCRMTTMRVLEALAREGMTHGDSTVKSALSELFKRGVLTNCAHCRPQGYGHASWQHRH